MRSIAYQELLGAMMVLVFLAASDVAGVPGEEPATASLQGDQEVHRLIPHWEPGDTWIVETVSRPWQARLGLEPSLIHQPVAWQFTLARSEKLGDYDCYRVEVTCQAAGRQPQISLWIDRHTFSLRQITTEVPVPNGFQEMTVRYDFLSGQTAPVLGPLTALPVDTPVFLPGQAKGLEVFTYRSDFGPLEKKAIGDLGFAHEVEQRIIAVSPADVHALLHESFAKSLLDEPFTKSIASRPVTEVRLKSHGQEIRQLWQAEQPWPIYCDNGYTVSRLVATSRGLNNGHPSNHVGVSSNKEER